MRFVPIEQTEAAESTPLRFVPLEAERQEPAAPDTGDETARLAARYPKRDQAPVSVLQTQPAQDNTGRRLGLGAGPISQSTAARAEQFVDRQVSDPSNVELRAAQGIQNQRIAGTRRTFGDLSEVATRGERERVAGEQIKTRNRQEFAEENPILGGMASGSAGLLAGTINTPQLAAEGFNKVFVDPVLGLAGADPMPRPGKMPGTDTLSRLAGEFAPVVGRQEMGEAWDKGEFAPWLVANLAQQSPQIAQSLVAAFAPPLRAVLLPGMGAQAAGMSYVDGDDPRIALAKGAVEIGTEMLPLQAFDKIGGILARLSPSAQKAVLAEAGQRVMRAGGAVTANMMTGAIEEAAAQVGGNALDRYAAGKDVGLTDGAGAAAVLGAAAGGAMSTPQAVKELVKPADRTPQIKALREQGDETAAAILEQRQQKEQAAYTTERETQAVAQINPELAQRYRDVRMAGAKSGDAVVQTAARWNFEQAAKVAGLTPKAQEAISAKLAELPPEKVAGFVQKAITGLVDAGAAQPFEGMDQIAANIEAQRDQMLDAVLSGAIAPTTPTEAADATQDTAQGAPEAATAVDALATPEAGAGADAVLGSAEQVEPAALSEDWQQFPQETETLGVPRAEMPQVKTAHRGAMVNFLNARGVAHEQVEVDPADLKPTQAEFSQTKVQEAADLDTDRSILISSDGHIIDGHHQAIAKLQNGKPVRAIRLDAPAADLLPLVREFPSSTVDQTSDVQNAPQATTGAVVTAEAPTTGAETPAVEAPAPAGGDAAAATGLPAAPGAGDVQADGVTQAQPEMLGRNSQPMSEGGTPFKTRAAAAKEKKLHPTMRVVKSKDGKGYVLKPMSAKQIAAAEKAAKRIKGVATGEAGPQSLHRFVLSEGGLAFESMADAGFDKNQRIGNRWLFSKTGKTLAKMAEALKEAGFITEETENAVSDGLRRSLVNPVYTPEGYEAMAQAAAETRYEDHLAAQQESEEDPFASLEEQGYTEEDTEGTGYDEASPEIQAEVAALSSQLEMLGEDSESIRERVAIQYPNATQQEYHEHLKAAITAAIAEAAQPAGRGDPGQDDGEQGQARELRGNGVDRQPGSGRSEEPAGSERTARDQSPVTLEDRPDGTLAVKGDTATIKERLTVAGIPARSILPSATGVVVGKTQAAKAREVLEAPTLTAPTKADIEAQQSRTEQAARDKAAADRAAERAAAQDEDRKRIAKASEQAADTFELGGDAMANLTGQKDIFGEPEPAPADDAKQKASEKIEDLGEKIGGARKDTAESTGKTGKKKTDDDRPAWVRRYQVSQVADIQGVPDAGRWVIRDKKNLDFMNQPKMATRETFESQEAAEAMLPVIAVGRNHRAVPTRDSKFEIWRDISDRKRVKIVDKTFDTREEALKYMLDHAVEIIEANTTFGEADLPKPPNTSRIGKDRRDGNVNGENFREVFGFRGVEFGNWNNQEERQEVMNEAYDGLLDLAEVMGIPPKAISMNGELALAFGARGHGLSGARAHYEPAKAVINLTKMNGAGALAHEWFHAMDHYFGRQDGKASAEWVTGKDGTRSLKAAAQFENDGVTSGFGYKSGVREEVRAAYKGLMETIYKKAEAYVEDTAKADKFVATIRGEVQSQLDSIRRDLAEQKDTRYYKTKNKPASAEQLAEFDTLAQQIMDGTAVETKYMAVTGSKSLSGGRWSNEALEKISAIYKAVRGRSGFDSTNRNGFMDRLRGTMTNYAQRLKMLADAQSGEEKTKKVPTDFAMDAKSLDQGRGTDYWTTAHEMGARAFQGYVEDRIAEMGGKSPFLNYGPEGAGILTPWGWSRPYPAGAERKAINSAIDNLVKTIQTREDDDGNVAMFSIAEEAPPFYSELARQIEKSPMNAGTATAWTQYLDSMAKRGAVKADEVEWTGLREWLNLQLGKVTKAQIAEYLDGGLPLFSAVDAKAKAGDTPTDASPVRVNITQAQRDAIGRLQQAVRTKTGNGAYVLRPVESVAGPGREHAFAVWLAKAGFGATVVPVEQPAKRVFNGAQAGNLLLLDVNTQRPAMAVMLHELVHQLRRDDQGLYLFLEARIKDVLKPGAVGDYAAMLRKKYADQDMPELTADAVTEELIADIVADQGSQRQFWDMLAAKSKNWAVKIARKALEVIDRLLGVDRKRFPYETDKYLTDIEAARKIVVEVLAEYSGDKTGAAGGDAKFSIASTADDIGGMPPGQQTIDETGAEATRPELPADTLPRRFQRKFQDQYNRFTAIRNWAKEQGMNLSQLSDVWRFEERMHGRMASRIEDFREKRVQPLVEKIEKAGFSMADVGEYLHAQHAKERNDQIQKIDPLNPAGSGMSTADAQAILSAADPKLAALANEFRAITDDTRDTLLQAGIISGDMVKAWGDAYKHYVPLKGGDDATPPTGTGKGLSVKATNKRAMGHGERAEFIIENIMRDHERAIMLAEKNLVGHSLLAMVIELGRPDIATFAQPEQRKVLKNRTDYEVVGRNGAVVGTFDSQQAANSFIVTQTRAGLTVRPVKGDPMVSYMSSPMLAENEVQIYAKGQTVRIQLNDPLLARAYKKLDVESLTKMMQINREINNFLSKAYTGYNPEFFFKNVLRDFTSGIINITGQEGAAIAMKAAARYPRAFAEMIRYSYSGKASPSINAYRASGGSTGAAYLGDIERIGADIQASYEEYQGAIQLARDGKPWAAAKTAGRKVVKKLLAVLEHLNAAGENAMRLAVFDTVRNEPGRSIQEAASLAKNSTVNFNRKGEVGAQAGALYLFFNPAVQGTAATLDALFMGKHKHQAQAVAGALALLAYSLASLQFGGDDEEDEKAWAKIPDHIKDRNLVIRTGADTHITLAIPYGYGYFFTLGNVMFDLQRGGDVDKAALKLTSGLVEHFGPAINPIGGEEPDAKGLVELVPGVFGGELMRAGARLLVNRSGLGGEIVPESPFDEGKPDNQLMYRTSRGTGYEKVAATLNQISGGTKSQAGMIDVSPETVKFWTQTITGGAGKFVMDTANAATLMAAKVSESDPDALKALTPDLRETPLVRTVVRKEDIRDARRVYWKFVTEAQEAQKAFRRAEKADDMEGMEKIAGDDAYLLGLGESIDKSNKAVKELRDTIDMIHASEDYTRGEKRMLIKDLEKGEQAIYDGMIDLFNDVRKSRP